MDVNNNNNELDNYNNAERYLKRWCLESSCNYNNPN